MEYSRGLRLLKMALSQNENLEDSNDIRGYFQNGDYFPAEGETVSKDLARFYEESDNDVDDDVEAYSCYIYALF